MGKEKEESQKIINMLLWRLKTPTEDRLFKRNYPCGPQEQESTSTWPHKMYISRLAMPHDHPLTVCSLSSSFSNQSILYTLLLYMKQQAGKGVEDLILKVYFKILFDWGETAISLQLWLYLCKPQELHLASVNESVSQSHLKPRQSVGYYLFFKP